MTTKTDTEQLRAEFEAWAVDQGFPLRRTIHGEDYQDLRTQGAFEAYQAGRAALQSQVKNDTTLFCDLKTDEEKSAFFLSGRGYETGVIAQSIQNDVAMAYHRCAEYKKELVTLQSQDREDLLKALVIAEDMLCKQENALRSFGAHEPCAESAILGAREAIDRTRRIEGEGE